MAESTGLEPVHRYPDDGLAIRCITTLPTLHLSGTRDIFILSFFARQHKFNIIYILNITKSSQNHINIHHQHKTQHNR